LRLPPNKDQQGERFHHLAALIKAIPSLFVVGLRALAFIATQQQAISDANGRATILSPISISVIQRPPVFLNLQVSIRLGTQLVAEAATKGAKLVVFVESWL
jgi:hypothetical protein